MLVLAAWTLLVWGGRIRNALADDAGTGPLVLAASFVVLALAVLVRRDRATTLLLAGWTVAVWAVRLVDIALLSDHGAAFVVVHAMLAAISTALAVLAVRATRSERAPTPTDG